MFIGSFCWIFCTSFGHKKGAYWEFARSFGKPYWRQLHHIHRQHPNDPRRWSTRRCRCSKRSGHSNLVIIGFDLGLESCDFCQKFWNYSQTWEIAHLRKKFWHVIDLTDMDSEQSDSDSGPKSCLYTLVFHTPKVWSETKILNFYESLTCTISL